MNMDIELINTAPITKSFSTPSLISVNGGTDSEINL